MHLHTLQGVNVNNGKNGLDNDYLIANPRVLEGHDHDGDFAIAARCDSDGKPLIISEAHLNLEMKTANTQVRVLSTEQSLEMRTPDTLSDDSDILTAAKLAQAAMDIAISVTGFSQYNKVLEELQTRR